MDSPLPVPGIRRSLILVGFAALAIPLAQAVAAPPAAGPVSYFRQVRPIFQAQCQGCHQPAKPEGGFVMTEVKRMLAAGDSGLPGIVPGKPEGSELLSQITPDAVAGALVAAQPREHRIDVTDEAEVRQRAGALDLHRHHGGHRLSAAAIRDPQPPAPIGHRSNEAAGTDRAQPVDRRPRVSREPHTSGEVDRTAIGEPTTSFPCIR